MRGYKPGPAHPQYKHGLKGTSIYNIWINMRRRCNDVNNKQYPWYGGRGIKVCDRWQNDVAAFNHDMGPRPSKAHGVERKNNNLGYSPSNCVWATSKEQANNRRSSRLITHNGKTQCVLDWARALGLDPTNLARRLARMPIEDALVSTHYSKHKHLTLQARTMTVPQWAATLGVKENTLWGRIIRGWSDEAVLTTPVVRKPRSLMVGSRKWKIAMKRNTPLPEHEKREEDR